MLTGDAYRQSLRDGRVVYIDGARVDDVTMEPAFRPALDWLTETYERFHDPEPSASGPYFTVPTTPQGAA